MNLFLICLLYSLVCREYFYSFLGLWLSDTSIIPCSLAPKYRDVLVEL